MAEPAEAWLWSRCRGSAEPRRARVLQPAGHPGQSEDDGKETDNQTLWRQGRAPKEATRER